MVLSCVLAVAAMLAGCGEARKMQSQTLLLDGANPPPKMVHVEVVSDPFATTAPEACPVLKGGPPGAGNRTDANKATLLNPAGFFRVPDRESQLRLIVAVRGPRELKISVLAENPAGQANYSVTLPAADSWQEVVLPIDRDKLRPGSVVNDITVFQLGQRDSGAELYVRAVTMRTY